MSSPATAQDHRGQPFPAAARATGWRRQRTRLTHRVNEAIERARILIDPELGIPELGVEEPARAAEVVATLSWLAVERLREARPRRAATQRLCELVADLQELSVDLHDFELSHRTRRIAAVEAGLASLRAITTVDDLLDRVCKELLRSGGFGRALLSKVEDGVWTPWVAAFEADMPEWFDAWLDTRIPLTELVLESQLLTEQRPALVHDTQTMAGVHVIVHEGMSNSYVVAPVMPAGKVVGLLHADHHPRARRADEIDRDVLWAFAEGFGHIYERTVLRERLRAQRDEVREVLSSVDGAMEQLCDAEMELAAQPSGTSAMARTAVSVLTTMSSSIEDLTPREAEVLSLMVAGAKNGEIAERLVITEGTVKSHVKHILRKLGAANRSQAIAHYLGIGPEDLG